jgi:hypothetical protein
MASLGPVQLFSSLFNNKAAQQGLPCCIPFQKKKLAKDVLVVPVSAAASKSAFSTGGRVISSFRSSMSPKMVESLICAQSWLHLSPKDLDIQEIIRDLQNYEELKEGRVIPSF